MKHHNRGTGCGDSCCLKLNNVSVRIGGSAILKDVTMHVHCGEMVALIGPNAKVPFSRPFLASGNTTAPSPSLPQVCATGKWPESATYPRVLPLIPAIR